jgi:diguanylate cyclase (GGDEF)-like protein/PAS domain S-box-containing protein
LELGPDTTITAVGELLATELGYRTQDLVGRRLSTLLPPDDLQRVGAVLVALVEGKVASVTAAQRLLHGSGVWVEVALSARMRHEIAADIGQGPADSPSAAGTGLLIATPAGFLLHVGPLAAADPRVVDLLPVPFRHASIAAAVVDPSGHLAGANMAWADLFGAAGSTEGNLLVDLLLDGVGPELRADLGALASGRRHELRRDLRVEGVAGIFWCRVGASRLDTDPPRLLLTAEDITHERLRQRILAANETLFRSVAETSPVGMARVTDSLVLTYANPAWLALMGHPGASGDATLASLLHDDDIAELEQARDRGFTEQVRCRLRRRGGHVEADDRWVSLRFAPLTSTAAPDPVARHGWVVTVEEVTDLVQRHQAASRLAAIVERTTDLVGIVDVVAREVVYLNAAASELFGAASPDMAAVELSSVVPESEHNRYRVEILPQLARGEVWSGEVQANAADGSVRTLLVNLAPDLDRNGVVTRVSGLGRDITEQRRTEEDLAYRATHDTLTGLPNRSLLVDHLRLALARARREESAVAVLFCDLDRFKAVNDTLGHEAGDELLVEVARRLRAAVRPSDTVARLAGDEFVMVCEQIESEVEALSITARITTTIDQPYLLTAGEAEVTASIGVALSDQHHDDAIDLVAAADAAMYRAKRAGRARAELFDDELRARNEERVALSRQLREAIDRAELELHYQPIVTLASGRVEAAETLVRWQHPTRGLLGATDILGVATDTGLMLALDEAVLAAACRQGRVWHDLLGGDSPVIHVNLSNRSLTRRDLPAVVAAVLHDTGLPARKVCLELSGSTAGVDHGDIDAQLERLDELGVMLAIDDFGLLPAQLSRLRVLPIDIVKLDPSLTAAVDADAAQVVAGIVALAHALELRVVAEGVESDAVTARLRELGCDAAQGHAFGMPGPSSAAWLPAH